MSEKIYIEKEMLKQCLEKAFDEGWTGYKDLKEEVVLKLISEVERTNRQPEVTTTTPFNWSFGSTAAVTGTTYTVGEGIVLNVSNNVT